jgi:hypothetical protein
MQVLCNASKTAPDVRCPVCGDGFQLFWERTSRTERGQMLGKIQQELIDQHAAADGSDAVPHPEEAFNIPSWSGPAHFSGAALLGGFPGLAR